jgi:hypothetical protein
MSSLTQHGLFDLPPIDNEPMVSGLKVQREGEQQELTESPLILSLTLFIAAQL